MNLVKGMYCFCLFTCFQVATRWPRDNDSGIIESTVSQLSEYFLFTMQDALHVLYIAVGLTILRFFLDFILFKVSVYVCACCAVFTNDVVLVHTCCLRGSVHS